MDTVEAINLTKFYGSIKAVEDLSFKVREGEIFGLLGQMVQVKQQQSVC